MMLQMLHLPGGGRGVDLGAGEVRGDGVEARSCAGQDGNWIVAVQVFGVGV